MKRSLQETIGVSLNRMGGIAVNLVSRVANTRRPTCGKTILFESFYGENMGCSPRVIYEYMRKHYPGEFIYVWAVKQPERYKGIAERNDTIVCEYLSELHRMYCCTAKVLVCNCVRDGSLPSRKEQVQINTWHGGGCYKSVGTAQRGSNALRNAFYRMRTTRWDYFLSSCQLFSNIELRQQMGYSGEILSWGLPRNDCLITPSLSDVVRAREKLDIPADVITVLVAPTFRDDGSIASIPDCTLLRQVVESRFGKRVFLMYRGHPSTSTANITPKFDVDLTHYEDSQGTLLASDVLITDFSSILWDFSLLNRPLFLYAPDYDEYVESRGFCVTPEIWGFTFSRNDEQLAQAVTAFDAGEHMQAIEAHQEFFGTYETGNATVRVADLIKRECG